MSSENDTSTAAPSAPIPTPTVAEPLPEVSSDPPNVTEPHAAAHPSGDNAQDQSTSQPAVPPTDEASHADATITADENVEEADGTADGADGNGDAAPAGTDPLASTPQTASKKNQKRKSTGGVPEHKSKKQNKKKAELDLHVDAQPGEYYFARLKGFPPWPAIICDEEMLPETLLQNRPVSTKRPDGSYREDYEEGGRNYKERTFPVMFLHTNEFQFIPNYQMTPIDLDEVQNLTPGKKSKPLLAAYEVAKERHDLDYFKNVLYEHEQAIQEEMAAIAERERKKKEKAETKEKEKKTPRKSKGGDDDVKMDDADDEEKKTKSSKKRKTEGDQGDSSKPAKTPKTAKVKLNLSKETPNGESSSTKAKSKSKGSDSSSKAKPKISEQERLENRRKEVLFFRHKLQKGFLSTDNAPDADTLKQLSEFIRTLETNYKDLEVNIIRVTKINKVLKAIIRLDNIPSDEEYNFRKRSLDLLDHWQKAMSDDPNASSRHSKGEASNGVSKTEKDEDANGAEEGESPEKAAETPVLAEPSDKQAEDAETAESPVKAEVEVDMEVEPKDTLIEAAAPGDDAKDEADGTVVVEANVEATEPMKTDPIVPVPATVEAVAEAEDAVTATATVADD